MIALESYRQAVENNRLLQKVVIAPIIKNYLVPPVRNLFHAASANCPPR
jgi:hypothetical protein